MKSLLHKILLIHSILITNIIIFVGGTPSLNLKQENTSYTLKNISESFLSNETSIESTSTKNVFINFLELHKKFILSTASIILFSYFTFRPIKTNISYNVQPKIYCSNL